jgi:hypothetical protein
MANAKINYIYDYLEADWDVTKAEVEQYLADNTLLNDEVEEDFIEDFREACREYEALD